MVVIAEERRSELPDTGGSARGRQGRGSMKMGTARAVASQLWLRFRLVEASRVEVWIRSH